MRADAATRVTVAASGDHFLRGDERWFLLADTVWSAFYNVDAQSWTAYLGHRQRQGFDGLNLSVLPILHDMSDGDALPQPFRGLWDGTPRFGPIEADFAAHMGEMLADAVDHDFVPLIVLLWTDFTPGTEASSRAPRYAMPGDALGDYLASVVEAVARFDPLYVVSGDADFRSTETVDFYLRAAHQLRDLEPDAMVTFHMRDDELLPGTLADLPGPGFYSYQSGHHLARQHNAIDLATHYRSATIRRPIVNLEPCYEGHGHGFGTGRFTAVDVRRATWQSILAGASAGVGYGAHGVWQWHERGRTFNHAAFSGMPFDHRDALRFPGAADVAEARVVVDRLGLHDLVPRQDLLVGAHAGVRAAISPDRQLVVAFLPEANEVTIFVPTAGTEIERIDLATRRTSRPHVRVSQGELLVEMPADPTDALLIIRLAQPLPAVAHRQATA
jgi:hypothetical protein